MEAENDFDPAVAGSLESATLVSGLPGALAERKIRVPARVDRSHLAALLEYLAQEIKLASVSEDFLRTRTTPFAHLLLPPAQEFRVRDTLLHIARTFGQRMVYDRGVLYVTTLTRGRDLRAEPPAELIARLGKKTKDHIPVDLNDLSDLAALSPLQLQTLFWRCPADLHPFKGLFLWLRDAYPVLHLYALLSEDQRVAAQDENGLSLAQVGGDAGRWYRALGFRGLPVSGSGSGVSTVKPGRFYVRRHGDEWHFLVSLRQGSAAPLWQRVRLPSKPSNPSKTGNSP
jgi:hypothetical protein